MSVVQIHSNIYGFPSSLATRSFLLYLIGRREWIRTTDPHHVKVVL
jgi:hypothetical protein